jgi:hypothetical protein
MGLDVRAGHAHKRGIDVRPGRLLGLELCLAYRGDRLLEIDHNPLAKSARRHPAHAGDRQVAVVSHLGDHGADLGRADIDPDYCLRCNHS